MAIAAAAPVCVAAAVGEPEAEVLDAPAVVEDAALDVVEDMTVEEELVELEAPAVNSPQPIARHSCWFEAELVLAATQSSPYCSHSK